ncbi:Tetraspanin-3, partial [Tauraco erythrolophus]
RPFAQTLLRFLGFVLWGAAAALALGGVFVILLYENYRFLFQGSFMSLPGWLAAAGALILLPTGVLAISVSTKKSRYQQGTLMYLLLILLCLEVSSAVMARFYSIRMTSELKNTMDHLVYQYNRTHSQASGSRAVDAIQRKLHCCAIQNYTDWLNVTTAAWNIPAEKGRVPESCCKDKYSHCRGDLDHLEEIHQEGCLKKLEGLLNFVMVYVFWCCIVLSVLELFVGVSNGILMRHQSFRDLRIL